MVPKVGDQFRQFRILSVAGEGGMGEVLRAEDMRLGRNVALKFLTRVGSLGPEAAERLKLEARSLAALNHANIVTIYDIDDAGDEPFLVLEWVSGTSLAQAPITRPCSQHEFLRIALPVAEALAAAHSCGIVHRDVKPGNILIGEDGRVKLVDFGLAKLRDARVQLTRTTAVVGTPAYMSPEQASGTKVGPPSDVFSFGAVAYEMLTGRLPFEGDSLPAVLFAITTKPHVPLATRRPDLSPEVASLVERCLKKRPSDRFADGAELSQDLHLALRNLSAAQTRGVPGSLGPAASRNSSAPEIRYARTADGVSIAYSVHGSGPVLVRVLGWFTHLEMEWEWPALRRLWERLGETHTVVRYDGRGIGLSAPWAEEYSEETRYLDLNAVLDTTGSERVALYGISEGGWTAAHYAARHPRRVSHLIVYGGYSRGVRFRPGYDAEETNAVLVLMRKGWGRDTPQYRQIFTTAYFGADADPGLVAHFNQLQRAAADGDSAARYQESLDLREDAQEVFASIRVPTLVLHSRDDRIISFDEGRRVASLIPGARFLPLPTMTHYFPIDDDETSRIAEAITLFTR